MDKQSIMLDALPLFNDSANVQKFKKEQNVSLKGISDGYHTFADLYMHRCKLSAIIFNLAKEYAWKSMKHEDGTMFDGDFIVGVSIPGVGDYSYHYKTALWDMFDVPVVENAPAYDGHTPEDIDRLFELVPLINSKI